MERRSLGYFWAGATRAQVRRLGGHKGCADRIVCATVAQERRRADRIHVEGATWKSKSGLLKDLVVADEAVGDGQEILFDFAAGDFVAGDAEDGGCAVGKHDQGIDNE